jgi:hypothetical protein
MVRVIQRACQQGQALQALQAPALDDLSEVTFHKPYFNKKDV